MKLKPAVIALPLMFAGAIGALPASAQTAASMLMEQGHTLLVVNAEGKSTRTPDMAQFSAGVATRGATASAALNENAQRMNAVIAALKKAGIADRDIQTSNLSINPVYSQPTRRPDGSYDENERKIVAYEANNQVEVRQRKLDDYGKVIDALVTAGANQVNGPSFTLSQPQAAEDEARVSAIKEARRRADLYAGAAGLKVVRILGIDEAGRSQPIMVKASRMMADSVAAAPPVAAGEVDLQSSVTVRFELAP